MNRIHQISLGALAIVACAIGAADARATPVVPVSTVTQPTAPRTFHINVGTPAGIQTPTTLRPVPIPFAQNTPYEHSLANNGSRFYVAVMDAQPGGSVSIYSSSSSGGGAWTFGTSYQTNVDNLRTPYILHCVNIAVDAGNPNIIYLTYYADGGFGSVLGVVKGTMNGVVPTFDPSTRRFLEMDNNTKGNLQCPDTVSQYPGSVIVAAVIEGATSNNIPYDSVMTWTSIGDYGASIGGLIGTAPMSGTYYQPSNTNTGFQWKPRCTFASNDTASSPRLFTNGNGTVCVTYAENSGCQSANSTGGRFVQCSSNKGQNWTPQTLIDFGAEGSAPWVSGAISPSGANVALAWTRVVQLHDETMLAFSNNSGVGWLPAMSTLVPAPTQWMRQYPSATRANFGGTSAPTRPVLAWENDTALWLGQTLGTTNSVFMLDRTADNGVSWMGAVNAGGYQGDGIQSTGNGMVASGFVYGTRSSVTIPLGLQ